MSATSNRYQVTIEADPNVPLIRMTRDFDATPAQLMRAHTDPQLFARWVGPNGMDTKIIDWDATTGGRWRYVASRDGEDYGFHGSFHEVSEDRIVQTFSDPSTPAGLFTDEELEIQLAPQGSLTKLTLIHRWNGSDLSPVDRQAREARWASSLERLSLAVELPSTLDS